MRGDIAFVGFMLTADEWQALDAQSRAQLIAVATRRTESWFERPRRYAEGTGPHEVVEVLDAELLEELLEAGDFSAELAPSLAEIPVCTFDERDPECSFADLLDD
jgi:hypothetical protein